MVIWVNAAARVELYHNEDTKREKTEKNKNGSRKGCILLLGDDLEEKGAMDNVTSTVCSSPPSLITHSSTDDLNLAYIFLGGKLSLLPDANRVTVATRIRSK